MGDELFRKVERRIGESAKDFRQRETDTFVGDIANMSMDAHKKREAYEKKKAAEELADSLRRIAAEKHFMSGIELCNNGDYNGALAAFDEGANEYKWFLGNSYILRGCCYHEMGKFDSAIAEYNKALSQEGDTAFGQCFYERAKTYAAKKDYNNAIADCNRALLLGIKFENYFTYQFSKWTYMGETSPVYFLRGTCYVETGNWKEAVADFKIASSKAQEHEGAKKAQRDYISKIAEQETADKKQFEADMQLAKTGDIEACYRVGYSFDRGIGVSQNNKKAFQWYSKAAEKDHTVAQRQIGFAYSKGVGVSQNNTKACKWYKKAAEKKDELAELWFKYDPTVTYLKSEKINHRNGFIIGAIIGGIIGGVIGYFTFGSFGLSMIVSAIITAFIGGFIGYLCGRGWNFFLAILVAVIIITALGFGINWISNRSSKSASETTAPTEFRPYTATITSSSRIYITSEPKRLSEGLISPNYGDKVTITGNAQGNYYPVEYKGVKGWILRSNVKRDE